MCIQNETPASDGKMSSRKESKMSITSGSGNAEAVVDDSNSWVSEVKSDNDRIISNISTKLFKTNLAAEVVNEALDENFIPDISAIESWDMTEVELAVSYIDTLIASMHDSDSCQTNLVSSTTSSLHYSDYQAATGTESMLAEEVRPKPDSGLNQLEYYEEVRSRPDEVLRRLEYYEDLYKNDILIINAEDEDLPLPY